MADGAFRANRISAYLLYVVMAGAPLPLGSRDPATVALWCGVLGAGLILSSPARLRGGHLALLAGLGVVFLGFGFVLHEQLAIEPWIAAPHPIWAKASELLGQAVPPSVSIIRGEPFYALGPSLAAVLALTLGLVVGADGAKADRALLVVAWSGVAYAVLGFASLVAGPLDFLFSRDLHLRTSGFTGPFINRNTAATYFGSCAAVWLVLLMTSVRMRLPSGSIAWRAAARTLAAEAAQNRDIMVRFCMLFVCLAAMFMTNSRAGVLFSLFVMMLTAVLFFRRDLPTGKSMIVVLAAAATVVLVLLQFMGGQVEGRIDTAGLSDAGRLSAYRSTLQMIADHPWFGTGLGTFAAVFPSYRSGEISIYGVWDKAHSTPLELAVEVGVPLAALVAVAWLVALSVLAYGTRRSRRETVAPSAALAVALIALLHSSVDFSLQVTGYALVVFALLGVGLAQSFQGGEANVRKRRRRRVVRDVSSPDEAAVLQPDQRRVGIDPATS